MIYRKVVSSHSDVLVRVDRGDEMSRRKQLRDGIGATLAIAIGLLSLTTCTRAAGSPAGNDLATAAPTVVATERPTSTPILTRTPVPTPSSTPPPEGCLPNATFVTDVTVSDGTEFAPNETFSKAWRIHSTGCTPWPAGTRWVFVSGDPLGGPDGVDVPETPLEGTADIAVPLHAPSNPGTYKGYWQMQAPDGSRFGDRAYVMIVVPGAAATPDTRPTVSILVINNTGGNLTLTLDGPARYTLTLAPGNQMIQVVPGEYTYTGRGCGGVRLTGTMTLSDRTKDWTWQCQ